MKMSVKEIAKIAGVSSSTVSRVIHGNPTVDPAIAEKVQKSIEELGYEPKKRQRRNSEKIAGYRTGCVGLLLIGGHIEALQVPTMAELIRFLEKYLSQYDFQMVLNHVPNPKQLPSLVSPDRLDGVLVLGHAAPEIRPELQRLNPVLLLGGASSPIDNNWADWITPNYQAIGHLGVDYLLKRGHHRLGYLNVMPNHMGLLEVGWGFQMASKHAGNSEPLILQDGPPDEMAIWESEVGLPYVKRLIDTLFKMKEGTRPTGLMVSEFQIAKCVYEAMEERGMPPGRDLEIITRNNEDHFLSKLNPRPASIDVSSNELAARAVEKLLFRMRYPDAPMGNRLLVAPRLVEPNSP
jgi:DNA-binding LacI/PurR family transcriptional regulator